MGFVNGTSSPGMIFELFWNWDSESMTMRGKGMLWVWNEDLMCDAYKNDEVHDRR